MIPKFLAAVIYYICCNQMSSWRPVNGLLLHAGPGRIDVMTHMRSGACSVWASYMDSSCGLLSAEKKSIVSGSYIALYGSAPHLSCGHNINDFKFNHLNNLF
jgi:hypothetical protein